MSTETEVALGEPDDDGTAVRFGTFTGVFRPVFLTILGALIYLREGWLVGNGGVVGAVLVILAAYLITGTTSLSLSTIATNVRMRPGGAYAIISTAMGLEAGGAIGIPLFLAQALSASMYLYAFAEAWRGIFPTHLTGVVVLVAFAALSTLAAVSAKLAFRAQAYMLVVVGLAMASMFLGAFTATPTAIEWFGSFPDASLLQSFAIFFPAATGIMVGVGMSGSLSDPRRAIPRGTLWAWFLTLLVYLSATLLYAYVGDREELIINHNLIVDRALVGVLVRLGLLTSTLMAALSSLVAAPRLLQAMAVQRSVPLAGWLAHERGPDDPRNASIATAAVAGLALLSGSLDAIAPIVTSFFAVTFLAINLVVASEYALGMISFRPTMRVPLWVPVLGAISSAVALVMASPLGGMPELIVVVGIYVMLHRAKLQTPWETVNSGVSVRIADWAARLAAPMRHSVRAWKPDLIVPVASEDEVSALTPLVRGLTQRVGSVKWIGTTAALEAPLLALAAEWTQLGPYTSSATVVAPYAEATRHATDVLRGAFFPPNLAVVHGARHPVAEVQDVLDQCRARELGMILSYPHPNADEPVTDRRTIAVWLSSRYPTWDLKLQMANLDVPLLVGLLLAEARGAKLALMTVVPDRRATAHAHAFLRRLVEVARLPATTTTHALAGEFLETVASAPAADLHVFGMPETLDEARIDAMREAASAPVLFVLDSGDASALV